MMTMHFHRRWTSEQEDAFRDLVTAWKAADDLRMARVDDLSRRYEALESLQDARARMRAARSRPALAA